MKFNKKSFLKSLYKVSTVLFLVGYNFAQPFLAIRQLLDIGGEITPVAAADGPYTISSTSGIWTKVEGTSNYSGVNTSEIRWGTGNPRSGLKFTSAGTQTFDADQKFLIGDLTHMNWPVSGGTADSATLKVTLNFSQPPLSPNPTFSYKFNIKETSNGYYPYTNCPGYAIGEQLSTTPCDDVITFPNAYGQEVFTIGDMKYTLKIDGFQSQYPTGDPVSKFITEEKKNNVAYLVGHLSSVLVEKPAISIEKYVAAVVEGEEDVWHDADTAPGMYIGKGDEVKFKYVVQNTGNVKLTNIVVTDNKGVTVSCPSPTELEAGGKMTCNSVGKYYADLGLYTNIGTVEGTHAGGTVTASDPANYTGVNKIRICHATKSGEVNPYNNAQASMTGDVQGHDSHHGNVPPRVWYPGIQGTWDDIIPPFNNEGISYPGKNWDAYGQSVYYNNCTIPTGTLKVNKVTVPAGDNTEFAITGSGESAVTGAPTFMNGNTGTISSASSHTFTVYPGTYSVAETKTDGWEEVSNTCNGIEIAKGENKECTITNRKYGSLTIIKNATPSSDQVFSFTTTGEGLSAFTLVDNEDNSNPSKVFNSLLPGTYSVSEIVPSNWYLDSATCSDKSPITAIDLSAGENITCTFNNVKYGSISGRKLHDLDGLASTTGDRRPVEGYTIFIDANNNGELDSGEKSTTTALDGSYSFTGLEPGEYTVVEVMKVGWIVLPTTSTSWKFTLAPGEDRKNVDFINIEKPTIQVFKNVDIDGDGKVDLFNVKDWKWRVNNKDEYQTGREPIELMPGKHIISEVQKDGYYVVSMECTNKSGVFKEKTESKEINMESGDKYVCTFTNARKTGILVVQKEVINDNGGKLEAGAFSFKIDGGDSIGFKQDSTNPLLAENRFEKFPTGTYSITEIEEDQRGYKTTYDNCKEVVVEEGKEAICTIKNDDIAPKLTVVKHVDNKGNDGTKKAEDFKIMVDGTKVSEPSFPGSEDGVTVTLNVGEYKVTEEEDTENYTAEYSKGCSGTIGLGEERKCTIVNTGIDHKPLIDVTKTAGVTEIPETGGNVTFTYKVTNKGLEPVEITYLYDDKFGVLAGDGDCKVGTVLAVGASCDFEATFAIPANEPGDPDAPTIHKNIFTAKAKDDEENVVEDTDDEVITLTPVPSLKLVKNVVHKYNSDTSITEADWTLKAKAEEDKGFSYTGDKSVYKFVEAGVVYELSEEGIYSPRFEASNWTCTGGELTDSTIKLTAEDDVVCTITNTALPATVTVYKDVLDGHSEDIFKVQLEDGGEVQDISDVEVADDRLVAVFRDLDRGTYYPEEVELPDGYIAQGCVPLEGSSNTVENGMGIEFMCTNKVIDPLLQIEKSNDKQHINQYAGDEVTYTITVTAPDDNAEGTYVLNNVVVSDIAPAGFKYISGTWTAQKNGVDISVPEPTYDDKGQAKWNIGDMQEGDEVVLTYKTRISLLQDPGNYPDIAWVAGRSLIDSQILGASTVDPETPFVGTDVTVIEPVETEEGEVLGASITLPVTGASTYLTLGALIMMILGAITLLLKPFKKLSYALLTGLMAISFVTLLTPNRVLAANEDINVRIMQPATPTNKSNFNVGFVALDLQNRPVKVECYKEGEVAPFATFTANTGNCPVTVSTSGTYKFYVKATADSDTQTSDVVTVVVDLEKPAPVIDYSKAGNVIKFKTPNDPKIKTVEIHRSDKPSYTANESTRIHPMPVSPNTEYSWTDTSAEAGKTYYYALRTVDALGNVSSIVSDPEVVKVSTVSTPTATTTTTSTATSGEVAGEKDTVDEGEVAGETDDVSEGDNQEIEKTEDGKEKTDGDVKETVEKAASKWYIWVIAIVVLGGVAYYVRKQKRN